MCTKYARPPRRWYTAKPASRRRPRSRSGGRRGVRTSPGRVVSWSWPHVTATTAATRRRRAPVASNVVDVNRCIAGGGPPSHVRDHQPPRRRQDHADREVPAVRRCGAAGRRGQGPRRPAGGDVGLDGARAPARHLDQLDGAAVPIPRPRRQPARHPGHRDFSEDTYRVLAGVDAVVMVLDTAKGIESQTLKLFEVCRARRLPVITFLNKYDRPGPRAARTARRDRGADRAAPDAGDVAGRHRRGVRGVIDRRTGELHPLHPHLSRRRRWRLRSACRATWPPPRKARHGRAALDESALLDAVGAGMDRASFLAGKSTPVFVGSALTNFGVRCCSKPSSTSPRPAPRARLDGEPRRWRKVSASVYKVQANMDPRTATGWPSPATARAASSGA